MFKCILMIISLVFSSFPYARAQEVLNLTFFDLEASRQKNTDPLLELNRFNGKKVKITGFLYRLPGEEKLALASEPNLKSCCVGKANKADQQIFIQNELASFSQNSLTVEGVFKVNPQYHENGLLKQLYQLDQAIIIPSRSPSYFLLALIAMGALFSLGAFTKLLRNKMDMFNCLLK